MIEDKVKCSIEFDDEWIQEDCHWEYDRIFYFKFEVLNPESITSELEFYYVLGEGETTLVTTLLPTKKDNIYTSSLRWSKLKTDDILKYLNEDGYYLTISIRAKEKGIESFASASYDYYLKLPPQQSQSLAIDLVVYNPGEVKCSWEQPEENYDTNEAAGYCIEIFHCLENETELTKVDGLQWNATKLENGKYYIEKIPNYEDFTPIVPPTVIDETTEITFAAKNSKAELYIWEPTSKPVGYKPEFYFMPKELGIKPGDKYLFRVYPYNVYSTYFDENNLTQRGALLANGYSEWKSKVSKGIVRVKATSGWVEGQVWVMTENGWKQAEAVYAKTKNGWKEAQ